MMMQRSLDSGTGTELKSSSAASSSTQFPRRTLEVGLVEYDDEVLELDADDLETASELDPTGSVNGENEDEDDEQEEPLSVATSRAAPNSGHLKAKSKSKSNSPSEQLANQTSGMPGNADEDLIDHLEQILEDEAEADVEFNTISSKTSAKKSSRSPIKDLKPQGEIEPSCPHLPAALAIEANKVSMLKKYKSAVAWAAHNLIMDHSTSVAGASGRPAKKRKVQLPACGTCGITLRRPFICLHCPYGGCWSQDPSHIRSHLKDLGHKFCADVKSGAIFCSECDNLIYSKVMDDLYHSVTISIEEKETRFQSTKKAREPYKPWAPDEKETAALENTVPITCQGRRGLLNLGQTCFLNVVLQSLLHNPLLRNYFLSDKHNHKLCKNTNCMCCEMDKLFAQVYSGDPAPYGPTNLLAVTWRASSSLSGYAQHDAHEFFLSAMNQIHQSSRGSTEISCICIIHNVFFGQLQSDVRCEKCGTVASAVDSFYDISLELKGSGAARRGEMDSEDTLAECLRRFTRPEKLSSKYTCTHCGPSSSTSATKRLSISKLPPVLSFQFKRFEHKTKDKSSAKKIDKHIRFPASINMSPYTTIMAGIHNKENEKRNVKSKAAVTQATTPDLGPEVMYEYDLFAVINHEGQMDNGHYTNFARSGDEWYRFDDEKIVHTTLGAVLNSTAYMCFYAKRHLEYKPYTRPTYVLTRETEAMREREKERELEAARMKEVEDALLATV